MKKKQYYTQDEVDRIIGWTKEELAEMEREADKIIKRMHLKEARKKAKLTQQELANRSGVPRASISRIENGFRNVTINKLKKIASAMNMEVEIIFRQASK